MSACSASDLAVRKSTLHRKLLLPLLPMLLLLLLRQGIGERWYPAALLVYAPPLPLVLAASAGMLPGMRRRPLAIVLTQLAIGVCCVLLVSGFVVRRPLNAGKAGTLRVLTYNSYKSGQGLAPLALLIQEEQPDIVCLQEAGPGPRDERGGWRDLCGDLPGGWRLVRRGELAIATHLPVVSAAWVPLHRSRPTNRFHDRDALRVTVRIGQQRVAIVTTHLSVPTAPHVVRRGPWGWRRWHFLRDVREEQMTRLLQALASIREPMVLTGDLNSTPACEAVARLRPRFADAFVDTGWGWGYTFPAKRPLLRLDYILADRAVQAVGCRVVATAESDHRPVVADLWVESETDQPDHPSRRGRDSASPTSDDGEWRPINRIEAALCAE